MKLGPITTKEALATLLGRKIGEGQFRRVYECPLLAGHVVKVSGEHANVSNVMEWMIWGEMKDTKWSKWLAPCYSISPCGTLLFMARAEPLARRPDRVPAFLSDLKPENWGTLSGAAVAIDYGNNSVFAMVIEHGGLVRPDWRKNSGLPKKRTK